MLGSTNRNKIIEELFKSKDFNDCISKMHPVDLQDDLKSEVILALFEKEESELIKIYNNGGLKYYAVRIILNLIQSRTSPFYKKFRTPKLEFQDTYCNSGGNVIEDAEYEHRLLKEFREEKAMEIINGLYWYDKEIVLLYIQLGSYRAIEKATGIRWESCYDTVQYAIGQIRYQLRKQKISYADTKI